VRNILPLSRVITLFQSCGTDPELTRATRSAPATRLPLAFIFRTFDPVAYCARLALSISIQTFEAKLSHATARLY